MEVFHACLGATYGISIDCKIYLMLNLMASLQCLVFLHAYFQTFSSFAWASHHLALQEAEFLRLSARLGRVSGVDFAVCGQLSWPLWWIKPWRDQEAESPSHLHLLRGSIAHCSHVSLWSYISLPSNAHLETLWLASLIPKNWLALL